MCYCITMIYIYIYICIRQRRSEAVGVSLSRSPVRKFGSSGSRRKGAVSTRIRSNARGSTQGPSMFKIMCFVCIALFHVSNVILSNTVVVCGRQSVRRSASAASEASNGPPRRARAPRVNLWLIVLAC